MPRIPFGKDFAEKISKLKNNVKEMKSKDTTNEDEIFNEGDLQEGQTAAEQVDKEEIVNEESENGNSKEESGNEEDSILRELTAARQELDEEKNKYLRLSAEFDNFRKRTMKEKAELILNGGEKTILNILPVLDDMERALATMEKASDVAAVREGVDLIYQKFIKILNQNGVTQIETTALPLDTDYHEAIALVPSPTEELKGKIMDCVQKGYQLNEKVIRHAKVVVGE